MPSAEPIDIETPCMATGYRSRIAASIFSGRPPFTMKFSEITSTKSTGTSQRRKSW